MSSNLVTFSKLENYHITISKIANADYSSEEIDLPPLNKLKKICYSNIATKTLSPICVSILSDILRLSTEENNFTNNEITIFFTHLFNQLHDKNNTSVHTFVKYSITKVIECDAILLILQLKDCEKFINKIYELDNNSDKTEDDLNIGVSLLNCLIREDSVSEDRDHQNWLDIYGKNFMNKVIYDNEICQRVILENLRVFEDFVVRFYNDFILVNDGTFDLKNNYDDDDVLNQIDSFKHKGFIKMDKLNNLYLKLYQLDKSLLNNWFLFLQREILSDNKFVRIIAIRMIKNLIKFDIFFTKTNEALFKLLLLRSKDSESLVRLELFKQFDKLIMNIDQINKNHSTLFLETIELGLLDINTEIRLEVVSGLPNVLNKISPKIVKIIVNLCRDKNQTIRIISCKCLCQLLQQLHSQVPEEEEKIAKALLKLYYVNDFNINSQLDLFLPEYISFSLAKLNHLIELVQEDHKAKFCLFSLFTRYKPFNKFLLQYLDNILDNKNELENRKIINWFSKFFTDMVFFTDKMTFDVVTKLRPFITGRMNIWEGGNLTQFINFLKNDQNITDEKELTDFKLLIFRSTNSILDLNKFYSSLKESKNLDILVDSLITDKNCLTNLLNCLELFDIFANNLENNSDQFDVNLKRLYLLKSTDPLLNLTFNSNVIKIFKNIVEDEPYSMNNFIISELIPFELNYLLENIDNKNLKTISLATFNLICQNQETYGNLIDIFIEENMTNQLLEDEEEEDTVDGGENDDSDIIIPNFINIFNYDETNILVKTLLVIKSKENNNNSFAFYKSLVETQGNCIDIGKKVPKWWRLCIMKELLDVYLSKSIDPIYYEEFLGDSQATIQWFAIDSNKYVRRSFFNFIMQNFTELPMSVSFFIFFASEEVNINNNEDEENNDITDEYTQFITKFVSNPKFIEERYFERLTSRFIHNLSYLPSLATIDDDDMDRLDVIRDLVEKISFFLQFVLNKENCNLILTYCNLVFNYYDKLNAENDCLYLVADIFINIINNVVSQKNWTNLKIFEEDEFNKMKLPLDLFVKKENNKEVLLGGLKESLKPNEKQEIKKICARNRSLGASSLNSTSLNNNNNINHSDMSHNATIVNTTTSSSFSSKRKRRPEELLKKPIQYENLRKSKRNKREINYDEHDSMN